MAFRVRFDALDFGFGLVRGCDGLVGEWVGCWVFGVLVNEGMH